MRGKWVWWRMLDSCKLKWGNGYGWREQWRRRRHVVTVLFIMRIWSLCLDELNFSPCTGAIYKGKKTKIREHQRGPKQSIYGQIITFNQNHLVALDVHNKPTNKTQKLSRNRIELLRMYKIVRKSYLDRTNKLFPCSPRLRLGLFLVA